MSSILVYTVCYNYGIHLQQAVNSVLGQSFTDFRFVIFDDGSTEPSTIKALDTIANISDNRLSVCRNNTRIGIAGCANKVLTGATEKYIIRLDADDWLAENALVSLYYKAESDPRSTLVFSAYYYVDVDGLIIGLERDKQRQSYDHIITPAHGACSLISTKALKCIGGYSTEATAQDGVDLWLRLKKQGNTLYVNEPLFYYRQHDNSLSKSTNHILEARSVIYKNLIQKSLGSFQPSILAILPIKTSYLDTSSITYEAIIESLSRLFQDSESSRYRLNLIVSATEDHPILSKITSLGWNIFSFVRSTPNVSPSSGIPIFSICKEAYNQFRLASNSEQPDILCYLNLHELPNSLSEIDSAVDILLAHGSDSVFSVVEERSLMFKEEHDTIRLLNKGRFVDLRFSSEVYLRFDGCIIALWATLIANETPSFGRYVCPYHRPPTINQSVR